MIRDLNNIHEVKYSNFIVIDKKRKKKILFFIKTLKQRLR